MTDRELLEAAAKAAGYEVNEIQIGFCVVDPASLTSLYWNPLTDNADAFRLMVDMDMQVVCNLDPVLAVCYKTGSASYYQPLTDTITDKHAATRRAIVRAAAGE